MQSSFVKRQVAAGDTIQEHITRGIRMGRDHKIFAVLEMAVTPSFIFKDP
jgi:hypothetical protein